MSKEKIFIDYYGSSDIGMVRTENQDSFGKFPEDNIDTYSVKGQLFIVADGIGGHAGGKEASSLAVETINYTYFNSPTDQTGISLRNAIEKANLTIHQKAQTSEKFGRMGTTCTAMVIKEDIGTIGQVGDSKVFKIEKNKIEQLTMEHTQLNEMLREKILTEEEAKNYPSKSALSRALGMEEKVKVDIIENIPLKEGQVFVLCTDGLSKVEKDEILNIVTQNSPEDSCSKLISLANERGGKDNVTVQVLKIQSEQKSPSITPGQEAEEKPKRKKSKLVFYALFLIVILAAVFLFGKSFMNMFNNEQKENPVTENQVSEKNETTESNAEESTISQADRLLNESNYDKALILYQRILEKEPMNLSALDGVNNIAGIFHAKADKLKADKKFSDALNLYLKIQKIQPDNIEIKNSILICENQIKFGESSSNNSGINYRINGINHLEWSFINIDRNHYELEGNSITFLSTSFEKKSLISYQINNASVSADISIISNRGGGGAGIIFGYSTNSNGSENYYLLKYDEENFLLQHNENGTVEELAVQKLTNNNSDVRNIGIKCSGNLINIYDGMNLTYSWKSHEKIFGRVGVYADKNVNVKFQNILISGNK